MPSSTPRSRRACSRAHDLQLLRSGRPPPARDELDETEPVEEREDDEPDQEADRPPLEQPSPLDSRDEILLLARPAHVGSGPVVRTIEQHLVLAAEVTD